MASQGTERQWAPSIGVAPAVTVNCTRGLLYPLARFLGRLPGGQETAGSARRSPDGPRAGWRRPGLVRKVGSAHSRSSGELVLAYDYPLLGVFWTVVLFTLFFLWIFVVLWTFVDNFRRKDHSGWAKALWFLFILFLPIVGVFVYLIARPRDVDAPLQGEPRYG
jgi:hypothetical protein